MALAFLNGSPSMGAAMIESLKRKIISPTVDDLTALYLEHSRAQQSPHTHYQKRKNLKNLSPYFGSMRVGSITKGDLNTYRAKRLTEVGAPTVVQELRTIRNMIVWAHELGYRREEPPKVKMPKCERRIIEVPTQAEVDALMTALPSDSHRVYYSMLWAMGLRKSEALALRWRDINFETGEAIVKGKGNKWRAVYAPGWLVRKLEMMRSAQEGAPDDPVFLSQKGGALHEVACTLRRAVKRAGIRKRLTPHILRHFFATQTLTNGVDLQTLKDMMGHADISTTGRYLHSLGDRKKEGVEKTFGSNGW